MRHLLSSRLPFVRASWEHREPLLPPMSRYLMSFLLQSKARAQPHGAEQELLMVPGMLLSLSLHQPLVTGSGMAETGQTLLIGQIRPMAQAVSLFRLPMIRLSSTRIQLLREVKLSLLT